MTSLNWTESVTGDISYSSNFDEANFSSPDNPLSDDGKGIPGRVNNWLNLSLRLTDTILTCMKTK